MKGRLRSLNSERGFGFIESGRDDYFFHRSTFTGHWGDLVYDYNAKKVINLEFDLGESPKGPRAENVRRLDHPNQAA